MSPTTQASVALSTRHHRRMALIIACLALLGSLGCGIIGAAANPHGLGGVAYWAAQTATAVPTETRFLGTTTPVVVTQPPVVLTTMPFWTTVTATPLAPPATATPIGWTATPFWVTTTPAAITATPLPPLTTTPGLPVYGFTTPVPQPTAYYRVGSFYMHSDVYLGDPDGPVLRLTDWTRAPNPRREGAVDHLFTFRLTNHADSEMVLPLSDVAFIRHSRGETTVTGRWQPGGDPLRARGLPGYARQLATPIPAQGARTVVLAITAPAGDVDALGLLTNWGRSDARPIWFLLERDPDGPYVDAVQPPPPTPVVLGMDLASGDGTPGTGDGQGMWPTTGAITRGFGCHAFFTGVDGAGYGCPPDRPWFHNGVDVANAAGMAVWSPVAGAISYAGPNSGGADCSHLDGSEAPHQGLGLYQRIDGAQTRHYLGHLRSFVLSGGPVQAGQTTAAMGSTGCSTGSHLHWMVFEHGRLVDPETWAGGVP